MSAQLESMLAQWEQDKTLPGPSCFSRRMEILDALDRVFSGSEFDDSNRGRELADRSRGLSAKLNSANDLLFNSIRRQIRTGICPSEFNTILQQQALTAPRGLAYDVVDDLIAGVLQFEAPSAEPRALSPDSVFYQPTPARHIFHLITAAAITRSDTLIDLGSGLGHVPLLASIYTGATSIGIELDPAWVDSATRCAEALNLHNVTFRVQDAREADFSAGTVFYLYTPFTGAALAAVLEALRKQAALRPIRICTFGPCTNTISEQPWLKSVTPPTSDQITVFIPHA